MKNHRFLASLIAGMFIPLAAFSQDYPVRPELSDPGSFSMVVIPDPQSYNKFAANQPLFELQTAWIANNIERLNIKTALCTGDLVEQNNINTSFRNKYTDQTGTQQWNAASRAFERLDNRLPYILCTGNHDYGHVSAEYRKSDFSKYFIPERNICWEKTLVSSTQNGDGVYTLENAAYEFKTDTWGDLLVVSVEFAPRDEVLQWAKELVAKKEYQNHKVILLTHTFITKDATRREKENYKISPANYGKAIWEKLVYPSANIRLVICGHECAIVDYEKQSSFRMDKNQAGKDVAQMMFNAQTADGKWNGNGGDCWLRILEFLPDGKTIKVRTFSPLFALSDLTADKSWRNASFDQYDIVLE